VLQQQGIRQRPFGWAALTRLGLVLAAVLLTTGIVSAQEDSLTVDVANFAAAQDGSAQAVITALDQDGRPLAGLTQDNFHARVNGTEVPLTSVTQGVNSDLGISIVLTLDTSSSMQGAFLDQAKAAAKQFLQGLRPQDSVAIVKFSTGVQTVLPFTQDKVAAAFAIDTLVAGGATTLYQATVDSTSIAAAAGGTRRAVVLLSDGLDFGSQISREDGLADVGTSGVPVFVIGLGTELDRAYLNELAVASGGQFAETPNPEGLTLLYQSVNELLRGQYILTLDTAALELQADQPTAVVVDVIAGERTGSGERTLCAQLCVVLDGVSAGDQVEGARSITAHVASPEPVTSVVVLIDGEKVRELTAPPYQFNIDPATVVDGKHTLEVRVTTGSGATTATELAIRTGLASGGLSSRMMLLAGAAIAVIVAVAGWLALRLLKRRNAPRTGSRLAGPLAPVPIDPRRLHAFKDKPLRWPDDPPAAQPTVPEDPLGRLIVVSGPLQGQSFAISDAPAAIGSGHRCIVRLPEEMGGEETPPELARVWIREGHLMVHEVSHLTVSGSTGGTWAILNGGDTFPIGPCTFRFELLAEGAEQTAAVPNILRDPPGQPDSQPDAIRALPRQLPDLPSAQVQPDPTGQTPLTGQPFPDGQALPPHDSPLMPGHRQPEAQPDPFASPPPTEGPTAPDQPTAPAYSPPPPRPGPLGDQPPTAGRTPPDQPTAPAYSPPPTQPEAWRDQPPTAGQTPPGGQTRASWYSPPPPQPGSSLGGAPPAGGPAQPVRPTDQSAPAYSPPLAQPDIMAGQRPNAGPARPLPLEDQPATPGKPAFGQQAPPKPFRPPQRPPRKDDGGSHPPLPPWRSKPQGDE
jgi:Mg-chelatase subunit ChlD